MLRSVLFALCLLVSCAPVHAQNAAKSQALTNTPVSVKGSPGVVGVLNCYNPNGAVEYVQFFDTLATVTPGTTVPKFAIAVTPSTVSSVALGVVMFTGIQVIAATTATGGSAPASPLPCTVVYQ